MTISATTISIWFVADMVCGLCGIGPSATPHGARFVAFCTALIVTVVESVMMCLWNVEGRVTVVESVMMCSWNVEGRVTVVESVMMCLWNVEGHVTVLESMMMCLWNVEGRVTVDESMM